MIDVEEQKMLAGGFHGRIPAGPELAYVDTEFGQFKVYANTSGNVVVQSWGDDYCVRHDGYTFNMAVEFGYDNSRTVGPYHTIEKPDRYGNDRSSAAQETISRTIYQLAREYLRANEAEIIPLALEDLNKRRIEAEVHRWELREACKQPKPDLPTPVRIETEIGPIYLGVDHEGYYTLTGGGFGDSVTVRGEEWSLSERLSETPRMFNLWTKEASYNVGSEARTVFKKLRDEVNNLYPDLDRAAAKIQQAVKDAKDLAHAEDRLSKIVNMSARLEARLGEINPSAVPAP